MIHFANMDDEKCFALSNSKMKGNDAFYIDNVLEVSDDVKYKLKGKFTKKMLVWSAIFIRDMSKVFVRPQVVKILHR